MKFSITFWIVYYFLHCYYRIKMLPVIIVAYIQGWIDGIRGF